MIGTTEAFTRQPINQLDCNTGTARVLAPVGK